MATASLYEPARDVPTARPRPPRAHALHGRAAEDCLGSDMKTKQPSGLSSHHAKKVDLAQPIDVDAFSRSAGLFALFSQFRGGRAKVPASLVDAKLKNKKSNIFK